MLRIRAILFDADDVIQYPGRDDLPARLELALGFIPDDLDAFVREVFEAERPALTGQADFAEMLEPVVAKWGAPGAAAQLARAWWCSIETDAALLALVLKVRSQGIVCALASNQQRYRASYMGRTFSYDAVFDRFFYSFELGFMKPDVGYFTAIVTGLRLAAEEVLFIDDVESNVVAAQRAGLQAAQFIHPRSANSIAAMRKLLDDFSVVVSE